MMAVRPATSPTTLLAVAWFGRVRSLVLWTKASGTPPRRLPHCSATLMRPASGETTTAFVASTRPRTYSTRVGIAQRWSTGPSKNPWDWEACRSTLMIRSAPAVLNRSASRRAEIGSRPLCFLSWRA